MIFIYLQIVGPKGRFSNGKSGINIDYAFTKDGNFSFTNS